jgi:hypothetical protein
MTLFMISFPLMVLAVALAVLPLILMSHADHRRRATEAISRHRIPFTRHSRDANIY